MLPKILIRLSIIVLCFTAIPASAEWFAVQNIVPTFKKAIIDFVKEHWLLPIIIVLCLLGYFVSQKK